MPEDGFEKIDYRNNVSRRKKQVQIANRCAAFQQKAGKLKQRLIAPAIKKASQSSDSYLGQLLKHGGSPYVQQTQQHQHQVIKHVPNVISLPKVQCP